MKYPKEAQQFWDAYVPKSGQAATVQGELIRAIEKLRDEARRNGNQNWDDGHLILSNYILDTLSASDVFAKEIKAQVAADIARIQDYEHPETEVELYDRLTDCIVEWCRKNPEPIPKPNNPKLRR